ncbi:MAG TPA: hypothetical protein DIU48_05075, partial [Acidobacteria bacterium]|nr:hypothetical protein [Acidobacteriota bacterium]
MDGMRVAIDVRKIDDFGVGTYVRNLLRWLAKLDQENDYILICRRADCERLEALGPKFRPLPSRS